MKRSKARLLLILLVYFMLNIWKWRIFVAKRLKQPRINPLDRNYVFLASRFHLSFFMWCNRFVGWGLIV